MNLERTIARVLGVGIALACAGAIAGLALTFLANGNSPAQVGEFTPAPEPLRGVAGIVTGAARLKPAAIMQLGVLLLIVTPLARVLTTLIFFLRTRDRIFAGIALLVSAALLMGLVG